MNRILVLVFLALQPTVGCPALGSNAGAIVATITLPHSKVMPGVPFDIEVTLTNVSGRPATVGLIANLVVTLPDGQEILVQRTGENDHWKLDRDLNIDSSVQLAPGESVQKVAGWDRGSIPNWFYYSSFFSGPGTYEIGLQLERGINDDRYNDHVNYVGVLRTSKAQLTRVTPLGEDELIWTRMQKASAQSWCDSSFSSTKEGFALAQEIVQLHPASAYYPYALLLRSPFKQRQDIDPLLEAAGRFPDSPAYPYLVKAAGDAALQEASSQDRRNNLAEAERFYGLAQTYYREALKTNSLAIRGGVEGAEHSLETATESRMKLKRR